MSAWSERARFLFRDEKGTIDAPTWRRHTAWLVLAIVALTIGWWSLRPYAHHDLATTTFLAPMTILAFVYLVLYAFAILILAISYTMLSMKRLRDRGEPTGLAGLVPLLALVTGAIQSLQAKTPDVIAYGYVITLYVLLVGAAIWTVIDLGTRPGVRR